MLDAALFDRIIKGVAPVGSSRPWPALTALMFLSPIFYPLSSVNPRFHWLYQLNPLTLVDEDLRAVLLHQTLPAWLPWLAYSAVSAAIMALGFVFFQKTRKGFSDVI